MTVLTRVSSLLETDLFFLPMFITAMKTFEPFPEAGPGSPSTAPSCDGRVGAGEQQSVDRTRRGRGALTSGAGDWGDDNPARSRAG